MVGRGVGDERRGGRGCATYVLHGSSVESQLLILVVEVVNGTLQFRQLNSKWCISGSTEGREETGRRRGREGERKGAGKDE